MEQELDKMYGYLGIDTREENTENMEEIEVCGYPNTTDQTHKMCNAVGPCDSASKSFLTYKIPTKPGQSGSPIIRRHGQN